MAAQCAAVPLAHANLLPLPTLQSAAGRESDPCRLSGTITVNKCPDRRLYRINGLPVVHT